MSLRKIILACCAHVFLLSFCLGQSSWMTADYISVKLKNGDTISGFIEKIESASFLIKDQNTIYNISTELELDTILSSFSGNDYLESIVFLDRNTFTHSKMFAGSSAFPLGKGKLVYQNQELFISSVSYGVSEEFTLSASIETISPFFWLGGFRVLPSFSVEPKYSYKIKDNILGSVGVYHANVLANLIEDNEFYGAGWIYSNVTFGNQNNYLTVGGGVTYEINSGLEFPLFNLSGQIRLNRKTNIINENFGYLFEGDFSFLSNIFIRRNFKKKAFWDFGILFGHVDRDFGSLLLVGGGFLIN